jgi:hypothetical protein
MERTINVSTNRDESKQPLRRAYERPTILYEGSLEATAGICTPGKADNSSCPTGTILS